MTYTGILNPYRSLKKDKRKKKQFKDVQKIILEILKSKGIKSEQWYRFVNNLRNFATHEGVLTIDYVEDKNIHFYKKHWDRRYKVSMNTIIKNLNKFMKIRQALRMGLSDVNFWKAKMSIS